MRTITSRRTRVRGSSSKEDFLQASSAPLSLLGSFAYRHLLVKFGRLATRYGQSLPVGVLKMLGQEHNLSTVIYVLSHLPVDYL
jgi:hypothetical protein